MNVRMPDGTVVQNVPEGTTKEQLLQKYQAYKQPAATQPPQQSSLWQRANTPLSFAKPLVEAVAPVIDYPAQQVTSLLPQKAQRFRKGYVEQGVKPMIESFMSPLGLATLGINKYLKAFPLLGRGLSAAFAYSAGSQLPAEFQELQKAYAAGDTEGLGAAIGKLITGGAVTLGAGRHAIRGEPGIASPTAKPEPSSLPGVKPKVTSGEPPAAQELANQPKQPSEVVPGQKFTPKERVVNRLAREGKNVNAKYVVNDTTKNWLTKTMGYQLDESTGVYRKGVVPGTTPAPTTEVPKPEATLPTLEQDKATFAQLSQQRQTHIDSGDLTSPEYLEVSRLMEEIKNRYGGMPPGEKAAPSALTGPIETPIPGQGRSAFQQMKAEAEATKAGKTKVTLVTGESGTIGEELGREKMGPEGKGPKQYLFTSDDGKIIKQVTDDDLETFEDVTQPKITPEQLRARMTSYIQQGIPISQNDPFFNEFKDQIIAAGYTRIGETDAWVKPKAATTPPPVPEVSPETQVADVMKEPVKPVEPNLSAEEKATAERLLSQVPSESSVQNMVGKRFQHPNGSWFALISKGTTGGAEKPYRISFFNRDPNGNLMPMDHQDFAGPEDAMEYLKEGAYPGEWTPTDKSSAQAPAPQGAPEPGNADVLRTTGPETPTNIQPTPAPQARGSAQEEFAAKVNKALGKLKERAGEITAKGVFSEAELHDQMWKDRINDRLRFFQEWKQKYPDIAHIFEEGFPTNQDLQRFAQAHPDAVPSINEFIKNENQLAEVAKTTRKSEAAKLEKPISILAAVKKSDGTGYETGKHHPEALGKLGEAVPPKSKRNGPRYGYEIELADGTKKFVNRAQMSRLAKKYPELQWKPFEWPEAPHADEVTNPKTGQPVAGPERIGEDVPDVERAGHTEGTVDRTSKWAKAAGGKGVLQRAFLKYAKDKDIDIGSPTPRANAFAEFLEFLDQDERSITEEGLSRSDTLLNYLDEAKPKGKSAPPSMAPGAEGREGPQAPPPADQPPEGYSSGIPFPTGLDRMISKFATKVWNTIKLRTSEAGQELSSLVGGLKQQSSRARDATYRRVDLIEKNPEDLKALQILASYDGNGAKIAERKQLLDPKSPSRKYFDRAEEMANQPLQVAKALELIKLTKGMRDAETARGLEFGDRPFYVPFRMERLELDPNEPFGVAPPRGEPKSGFRRERTSEDIAEYIQKIEKMGRSPLLGRDSFAYRARDGIYLAAKKELIDRAKLLKDPYSNKPLVVGLKKGKYDKDYVFVDGFSDKHYVHKNLAPLLDQLFSLPKPSSVRSFLAESARLQKRVGIGLDIFHMNLTYLRSLGTMYGSEGFSTAKTGLGFSLPVRKLGKFIYEFEPAEWDQMVKDGTITPEFRDILAKNKPDIDLGIKYELGLGEHAERIQRDLLEQIPVVGEVLGKATNFIFGPLTKSAVAEAFLNFRDQNKWIHPDWSHEKVIRESAREANQYFFQIGKRGVLKSAEGRRWAQIIMFAHSFTESILRNEFESYKQLLEVPKTLRRQTVGDLAKGKVAIGNILKAQLAAMTTVFIMNQVINLKTRGKFTWQNPEDDKKFSAYVPQMTKNGKPHFIDPWYIAFPFSATLVNGAKAGKPEVDSVRDFMYNRLSVWGQLMRQVVTERTPTFRPTEGIPGGKLKALGETAAESYVPFVLQEFFNKGDTDRQILASFGIKPTPTSDRAPAELVQSRENYGLSQQAGWIASQVIKPIMGEDGKFQEYEVDSDSIDKYLEEFPEADRDQLRREVNYQIRGRIKSRYRIKGKVESEVIPGQ